LFWDVLQVIPNDDYTVYIYFSNGEIRLYNAAPLLDQGIFSILKDLNFFKTRCTVLNNTLAWDRSGDYDTSNCLDLAPEHIYESSVQVQDPLIRKTA
jgi:hypothetical protein